MGANFHVHKLFSGRSTNWGTALEAGGVGCTDLLAQTDGSAQRWHHPAIDLGTCPLELLPPKVINLRVAKHMESSDLLHVWRVVCQGLRIERVVGEGGVEPLCSSAQVNPV